MGAKSRLQITPRKFSRQQPTFGSLHLFLLRCSPIGRYSYIVVVKSHPTKNFMRYSIHFFFFVLYTHSVSQRQKWWRESEIWGANFEIILPQKHIYLVMANLGQVLKKQVSGFHFKKPGYPGRVLGFQKCTNLANLD